jgi:hypothetical protein
MLWKVQLIDRCLDLLKIEDITHPYQVEALRSWVGGNTDLYDRLFVLYMGVTSDGVDLLDCLILGSSI